MSLRPVLAALALLGGAVAPLFPRPAAEAATVDCILVKVNDEVITLSEYDRQKRALLDEIYRQKLPESETQKSLEEARAHLIPSLVEEKLLMQKARDLNLSVTKEEVDRIVRSIMEQNKIADDAMLETMLRNEGMTVAQLRGNIERRSLLEKVKQYEVAARIVVTNEEAKRYYDEHREEFRENERVRLREIVLLTEKRNPDQVRKEIEEIAALVRNGADFAELATLFSQAPTSQHGGDLGLLRAADLTPEIAAAAAKLQPGSVSPPVETRFGFHILKLIERKPVTYASFEEARDAIIRKVQESRYGERAKAYVDELRARSYVEEIETCKAAATR